MRRGGLAPRPAEKEGPEAIGAGLRALLEHIAEDEMFARLAFFELTMAGPAALDQADRILGGFTSFFSADAGAGGRRQAVPPVILEAIGGGTWAVIQHEIAAGRRARAAAAGPGDRRIRRRAVRRAAADAGPASASTAEVDAGEVGELPRRGGGSRARSRPVARCSRSSSYSRSR